MGDVFKAKLRPLGSSACVIIPKERLDQDNLKLGDEIEISLLTHKKDFSGFGMARKFKVPFVRDKKIRDFK